MALRHSFVRAALGGIPAQAQAAAAIATYAIARPPPDLLDQLWRAASGAAAVADVHTRPHPPPAARAAPPAPAPPGPTSLREAVTACASRIATPLVWGTPATYEGALAPSSTPRAVVEPHFPYRAVHVNPAFAQLSGVDGDEARGAPLSAVLHALCADAGAVEVVADAASLSPLYDASGHVSHLLAVVIATGRDGAAASAAARQ
ncbi:hypothetical protein Rsub_05731 [Raphidocelis subcapitata]|uniref:PAS domain-containing protein n=1 Tax=Raphidocelis subcapitata TaxID=307507 RepID=A0A2V0P729_9CHLO|nr:hypothetical protein Rsub_05731 [Raphidocelis subcapitata]|eukprot:GBF92895.1 hypothetical protein Rsub_05731 [Raphidocelis subcapitata]